MQESDLHRLYGALSVIEDKEGKRPVEQKLDALAILGNYFWNTTDLTDLPFIDDICGILGTLMDNPKTPPLLTEGMYVLFALLNLERDTNRNRLDIQRAHTDMVVNNLVKTPSKVFFVFNLNCVHQLYVEERINLTEDNIAVIQDIWTRSKGLSPNRANAMCDQILSIFYMRDAQQKVAPPPLVLPPPSHVRFGQNPPHTSTTISFNNGSNDNKVSDNDTIDLSGLQGLQKRNLAKVTAYIKQIKKEKNQTTKFGLLTRLAENIHKGEFGLYECDALNLAIDTLIGHTRFTLEENPVLRKHMATLLAKELGNGHFAHNPKIENRVIDAILHKCCYADDIEQLSAWIDLQTAFEKGNFVFTTDHLSRLAQFAVDTKKEDLRTIAQSLYEGKKPEAKPIKTLAPKP